VVRQVTTPVELTTADDADIELQLLLEAIYRKFHWDFRRYSSGSLKRRLADALVFFGCSTLSGLQERLIHDERVFPELIRFLTVQVSELFRDAAFFLTLRRDIVPLLRTYPSLRIWIAGCSTGEEAYSYAILFQEEGLLDNTILYATDINPDSLRTAEAGVYAADRLSLFAENHRVSGARVPLSAHYTEAYGAAVFNRSLRRKIVFSDHSLATDGGFAEMQLISCRNVLIYFDRALQNRALGLFKDSLCRRGYLGLGARETLRMTEHENDFEEVAERWYQRR
jgi:chemotaxis protein methyltransferase CheR